MPLYYLGVLLLAPTVPTKPRFVYRLGCVIHQFSTQVLLHVELRLLSALRACVRRYCNHEPHTRIELVVTLYERVVLPLH